MRRRPSLPCALLTLSLSACGTSSPQPPADATVHDHTHPTDDASVAKDAAPTTDSGDAHVHTGDADDAAADVPRSMARDLTLRVMAGAHASGLGELALYDMGGTQRARAVVRGRLAEERVTLRGALPEGASQVRWFFDDDGDLAYDAPPVDRAGRVEVAAPPGPRDVAWTVSPPGSDIGAPPSTGVLHGRFTEFEPHVGVYFECSVSPEGDDRTVGLFRYRALPAGGHFEFELLGVLEEGRRYVARWFIDLNDNGVYDVRGDHGGELAFTGRSGGVTLFHQHHQNLSWTE